MRYVHELAEGVKTAFKGVDERDLHRIAEEIGKARRVFIAGMGRSNLVGRMFAVRLLQLKHNVFIAGDPLTPGIKKEDVLLVISGSGKTNFPLSAAKKAKEIGAKIIAITSKPDSPIGKMSDLKLVLQAGTKDEISEKKFVLGTLFEISALFALEGIASKIKEFKGITEEDMKREHANIE